MIVRPAGASLQLIRQPDHAALARHIMAHWEPLAASPRRDDILRAVGEHDNGWREPDAAPQIDPATGQVADFMTVPLDIRQGVWPRGIRRLAATPWTAALVAEHSLFVFERYRADPEWAAYFTQEEALRGEMLDACGGGLADLEHDYVYVRLGDLISLAFCNAWSDPVEYDRYVVRASGERVTVTPSQFAAAPIPFSVPARTLPNRRFTSDDDLRAAWRDAPTVTIAGEVSVLL